MTDAVSSDIKKVTDPVPARPIPQDFSLGGGLGIFSGADMVDHGFYLLGIKHPVFALGDQVVDRHRSCNFMAKNGIESQHLDIIGRIIDAVSFENFLSNCFAHNVPQKTLIFNTV